MDPINYGIQAVNPTDAMMKAVQMGVTLRGVQDQQQQRQLQMQRTQQMQTELATLSQNPTPQAIAAMSVKYPELSEQFKRSYDMMAPEAQRNDVAHMSQVYAAMQSGRNDIAAQLLNDRAQALENSGGDVAQIRAARTAAQWAQQHPESFKTSSGLMLSAALGPDKFATTFSTLGTEQRATELQPGLVRQGNATATIKEAEAAGAPRKVALENANIKSQIDDRYARLGLDNDKFTSETQTKLLELQQKFGNLPDDSRKIVNESAQSAVLAEQTSGQMLSLAQRLVDADLPSGQNAKLREWFKEVTGSENYATELRNEYTRLRTGAVLKNLPPGPATDKDIALAMKGFPSDTADPSTMASFLRGMAKLQQREAAYHSARSEWVGAVGHSGRPKTDIEIDGIKVPAGTSFIDFSRQFLGRMADTKAAQASAPAQPQQRSYMRWATGRQ